MSLRTVSDIRNRQVRPHRQELSVRAARQLHDVVFGGTVTTERTRKSAERAYARGHGESAKRAPSPRRSRAIHRALEREGKDAASHKALSRQAHAAAR
jgi:hypothetical protein